MSFFLTIIGNSIVIYAFWTAPSIAPPSRVFFINLAVSDLLVGLVVLPLSAVYRARILIRLNNQSMIMIVTWSATSARQWGSSLFFSLGYPSTLSQS